MTKPEPKGPIWTTVAWLLAVISIAGFVGFDVTHPLAVNLAAERLARLWRARP